MKIIYANSHRLIDMLTKFSQNDILLDILKRRPPLSVFTKISMYSCTHVAHTRTIPTNHSTC